MAVQQTINGFGGPVTALNAAKQTYEAKFKTLEEERSDALEMAAQAHEERKAQTTQEMSLHS